MPESPFARAMREGSDQPEGSSDSGGRRRKSRPTTSRRNKRQKIKEKYAKAREDAQLEGIIPTTPEGALKSERTHSLDPLDGLPEAVRKALRENWGTPDSAKPAIIAALLRPFFNDDRIIDKDGNLISVPTSPKMLNELARTILALDQTQYERDNPEAAGKAKGGNAPIAVAVQSNVLAVQALREALERDVGGGKSEITPFAEPSAPGFGRFDGEVEVGAASTED